MNSKNPDDKSSINPVSSIQSVDVPESKSAILSTPAIEPAIKWYKKKAVLIGLVVLLLIGGGVSAWALTINKEQPASQTTSSNPVAQTTQEQPEADKLLTTSGVLAYHLTNPATSSGSYKAGGDIWTTDANGNKKQLTKDGNLDKIYAWSPDSKYILTSFFRGEKYTPEYAIVTVSDGSVKDLNNVNADLDSQFAWLTNTEFGYIAGGKFYKTSVNDETNVVVNEVQGVIPTDATQYDISPDGKKVAFYETGERVTSTKLYLVNLKEGSNSKVISDKGAVNVAWGTKNLYFSENKSIVKYDLAAGTKDILLTYEGYRILSLEVSPDESTLIYVDSYDNTKPNSPSGHAYEIEKMHIYNSKSKEQKLVLTLPPDQYPTLTYSRDSSLLAYSLSPSGESGYKTQMRIVTVSSLESKDICTNQCTSPLWQP